jgi:hypothetical protein
MNARVVRAAGVAWTLVALLSPRARALTSDTNTLALIRAIRNNNLLELSRVLDACGPDGANRVIGSCISPLHVAAALNLRDAAGLLISRGAGLDATTDGGFTPLHWAAGRDAVQTVDLLVRMGADVNARTRTGITPLHWAANNNATNAVNRLLVLGADLTSATLEGMTPLHWAVQKEATESAVRLAYQAVSEELDRELAAVKAADEPPAPVAAPPVDDDAEPPDADRPVVQAPPPPPPDEAPRPPPPVAMPKVTAGKTLIVPLGFGETLEFVWLESMKLWGGKYEITNGQFRRFRPEHSSMFHEGFSLNGNDQPAVYVSWNDATAYARWLNRRFGDRLPRGYRFRLPSEQEWQRMAACGDNRRYPWGNAWPPAYGNFSDLTARRVFANWRGIRHFDDGYAVACPVGKSGANEWGIYGLAGNVWEWCRDWYDRGGTYKIRRGGSWDSEIMASLEVTGRGFDRPDARYDTVGCRLVVSKE